MVDDVKDITETAESKASQEVLDRSRVARERREAEQRKRLDELRAHAAAAQAQREKRDEDRRRRQAEQRARDDDRRTQVEERKRAIWEASVSRREALVQRERDRSERLERQRAARSAPRPAFAFGSSTPRLLEPLDSGGFFWAARSTNPIDQMNFFESLAASTTNVMFASAPLTRRASALQLDTSDTDNKDEPDRQQLPAMWSSVARRRTDLVPTLPAPRAPGRAYSMTRLDRLPHSPATHHSRTQTRSGDTTPSRPGSALSAAASAVLRRPATAPRKPRPASIAGTGVNTPRGGIGETLSQSAATTPSVSRDSTVVGSVPRRPAPARRPRPLSLHTTTASKTGESVSRDSTVVGSVPRRPAPARRPRPLSLHTTTASKTGESVSRDSTVVGSVPRRPAPAVPAHHYCQQDSVPRGPREGKPPLHRKPKPSKEHERTPRGKSASASPGRGLSPSPPRHRDSREKDIHKAGGEKRQVSAAEVTHKLEALQVHNGQHSVEKLTIEHQETLAETNTTETKHEKHKPIENNAAQEANTNDTAPENTDKVDTEDKTVEKIEKAVEKIEKAVEKIEKIEKPVEKTVEVEEKPEHVPKAEKKEERREEKKEPSQEKTDDNEMTASMSARRITTEEEAKAALAERRRRAREELERQAELERQRLQREAEEEAERQRLEREREAREEQEARELAMMQRQHEEDKLRRAIEAQQQLEKDEAERKVREEADRQAKLKEEEEKRKAAEEAEKQRREEAEREEKERLARKQRVEAIMARTRLRKAEEDKKQQDSKPLPPPAAPPAPPARDTLDNGNVATDDLLGFDTQPEPGAAPAPAAQNNGNLAADLLGLPQQTISEDKTVELPPTKSIDNTTTITTETNNGNHADSAPTSDLIGQIPTSQAPTNQAPANQVSANQTSANFIQNEIASNESQSKMADAHLLDDDFTTHNGHGQLAHPLTLQNAI